MYNYSRGKNNYQLKNELEGFNHNYGNYESRYQTHWRNFRSYNQHQSQRQYEYHEKNQVNVLQDFIMGQGWERTDMQENQFEQSKNNETQRKRQSRLDNVDQQKVNLLLQNRILSQNKSNELTQKNYPSYLPKQHNYQHPIILKKEFCKLIQQFILVQADLLVQCKQCNQLLQVRTETNNCPAIKTSHCGFSIEVELYLNENQQIESQEIIIGYVQRIDIIFIEAKLDVICCCGNILDALILDEPIFLENGKYILMANEYYRKLCRHCCKETILQNCELFIS